MDPADLATRSPASRLSFKLQGGPFIAGEARSFGALPFAADAARLRGNDDAAKTAGAWTPGLEHYRPSLEAGLKPAEASGQERDQADP